jgi:DNA-binding MarR family transcriptional regulator
MVSPDARRCAAQMLEGMPPVMWFIRRHMRRHRTCGLSVPQFRALVLLDRHPVAGVSLVAEHLGSSRPSASRLITGLVSRQFVTRRECALDRRQVRLELTQRGRTVLARARAATQERMAQELSGLDQSQRATVIGAMRILHGVFAGGHPVGDEDGDIRGGGS